MERAFRDGRTLKISIAATNPCHLWPLARELAAAEALGCYYSGYPLWKLEDSEGVNVRSHSLRTNVVYGLLKFVPERFRPSAKSLFIWQDQGFDRWVGEHLDACDFIHAMPGQALVTFRDAKQHGVKTVLNHATGPVREWVRIMEPEYRRVGLKLTDYCPYDEAYFAREAEEYSLTDYHCAASTVVRDQLVSMGIPKERVWVVPYGADTKVFHPPANTSAKRTGFHIVFAGMAGLRKGIKTLLDALTLCEQAEWRMSFYGAKLSEADSDIAEYRGATPLQFQGSVSQTVLADTMRSASVLVLPSLEEGFGLVVPQALNCGLPCIVSDRVGGKDLVRHHENGSIFPAQDAKALAGELTWWSTRAEHPNQTFDWTGPTRRLIALSASAT